MPDIISSISTHSEAITAVVAFIALVQPWLIAAYNRFARPGHVEIYETGRIEIGYGTFGPTIGLVGTLKASHRDFFIRRIRIVVVKAKDFSQHAFEWCLFRSQKLTSGSTGKGEETAMELPFSFMLMCSQPHRYNIVFNDQDRLDEIKQVLESTSSAWLNHCQLTSPDHNPKAAYSSFMQSQSHIDAYRYLNKLNYWERGAYQAFTKIETDDGASFDNIFHFELSEQDEKMLERNPVVILGEICGQNDFKYTFVYPTYQSKSTNSAT